MMMLIRRGDRIRNMKNVLKRGRGYRIACVKKRQRKCFLRTLFLVGVLSVLGVSVYEIDLVFVDGHIVRRIPLAMYGIILPTFLALCLCSKTDIPKKSGYFLIGLYFISTLSILCREEVNLREEMVLFSVGTFLLGLLVYRQIERNIFETKVEECVHKYQRVHMEAISHMYHLAELGRFSSGLLHDLANPLTAASLNLEQVKGMQSVEGNEGQAYLRRACCAMKRMESLFMAARKQMNIREEKQFFNPAEEIRQVASLFGCQVKKSGMQLEVVELSSTFIFGSVEKFCQLMAGILANVFDIYGQLSLEEKEKLIKIYVEDIEGKIRIRVGWGIYAEEKKDMRVFNAFFTGKEDKKASMRFSFMKKIIEEEFGGSLECAPKKGKEARYTLIFPPHSKKKQKTPPKKEVFFVDKYG